MISDITAQVAASFADEQQIFGQCVLTRVDISLLQQYIDEKDGRAFEYLVEEEKIRFSNYSFPKRQHEWLSGRIAAKYAAMQLCYPCGAEPAKNQWKSIKISQDAHGKPYLHSIKNPKKLCHISISHSHGTAVALASHYPCGVDIQKVTGALERVEERFVTPKEQMLLSSYTREREKNSVLGAVWSAKEAVKKASSQQPLPGFLDISLSGITKENGYKFEMVFKRENANSEIHYKVFVIIDNTFSLALTLNER